MPPLSAEEGRHVTISYLLPLRANLSTIAKISAETETAPKPAKTVSIVVTVPVTSAPGSKVCANAALDVKASAVTPTRVPFTFLTIVITMFWV